MRVVVVGGGIGGLACAQGLVRSGIDVQVVERDQDLSATAGYKLHLGVATVSALRDLLMPEQLEVLLGSAVATHGFTLAVRDHRGRRLLRAEEPSDGLTLDVDRTTLRLVLAGGLGDRLLPGRSCSGWRREHKLVVAELDDGSEIPEADVLVIADGSGSPLAERLAGRPTGTPCGAVGVAGRSPWDALPTQTRRLLAEEPMLAVGPGGTGLFATAHDPVGRAAVQTCRSAAVTTDPVVIWGLLALEGALPAHLSRLEPARLLQTAGRLLNDHGWARHVVRLLTGGDPATVSAFRLNASDPDDLAPWPASRVTALGDAVHVMPPTGGQGAAAAILDAHGLVQRLDAAARGESTAAVAVHDYETGMRARATTAVRESLQPLGWIRIAATPTGSLALRALTPVAASIAAVGNTLRRGR